jgi:hypothetical protein
VLLARKALLVHLIECISLSYLAQSANSTLAKEEVEEAEAVVVAAAATAAAAEREAVSTPEISITTDIAHYT